MIMVLLSYALAVAVAVAPDTTRYVVTNHGRAAGEMLVIRDGESVAVQFWYRDRNRGQRVATRYRIAPTGELIAGETSASGIDAQPGGEPTDQFSVAGDSVRWTRGRGGRGGGGAGAPGGRGATSGAARAERGAFYRLASGTPFDQALLARYLLKQPQRTARLLPSGAARLEVVADTTVTTVRGRERVRLVAIHAGGPVPSALWLDARDELFASEVAWFITTRPGAERALSALRKIELAWRDAQGAQLAARLTKPAGAVTVLANGDVFDSERGELLPRRTVVIRGDRIVAVGPSDSVAIPPGATVIDAAGKTVVAGLWDMHTHFQHTSQSFGTVSQLATGITTIRDLAADTDVGLSHRDRANRGAIVSPRVILAGFMEGPGSWAGPSDVIVRTEDEARAWVARYDSLGYRQIKLYNIVHPDLVPTIAREAHQRGLRLSGHVPRGMSVQAAVKLGFDEINHAAFLFSNFFQDSLYWPTMRPYSAVAALVAPNVNVDGAEMTSLIEFLRANNTVVDGTFNIWMGGAAAVGVPNSPSQPYARLLKRLFDAGVTLVPGTDNSAGTTYITELEIYQQAGIPAPNVLQIATIVPARVMKDDKDYGSIAAGKVADLIVVSGRPTERIADLRNLDYVVRAGRVYTPRELRAALSGVAQ
jgi:imidazolonepropionase-like amidohydrolase